MAIVNFRMIEQMRRAVSAKANKAKVGELVISEMKDSISKGISPVRGERRFLAYKNPGRYPGELKNKRPVNLFLSGDMLAALKFYPTSGPGVSVGIKGSEGIKAAAHNNGVGVPRRHFMPTESGEEFTVTITRKVRDLYASILSDILRK